MKKKVTASKPAAAKSKKGTGAKSALPAKKSTSTKQPLEAFKAVSKADAQAMMDLLCQRYPDADCELDFESDFQLLTAVILSAQTTDTNVNKVTPKLFKRFPDARSLAAGDLAEIADLVRPTGYFNSKAKNIQACAQAIVANFNGIVPNNLDDLVTLPGVGRKTANVVLGVVHEIPGWTVDTHVQRLSKRLGFSNEMDPAKIEIELQKLFPEKDWTKYSITLIWHGRRTCFARNPACPECPINHLCPSSSV